MRRLYQLVLVGVLSVPAAADAARVTAAGELGGGIDDNLNGAVASNERVGSGYGQITAGVTGVAGRSRAVGTLGLRYVGRAYTAMPVLSSQTATLRPGIRLRPSPWVSLSLTSRVGARWVADADRRSAVLGLGTNVRLRATRVVALNVGYDLSHRIAVEPVFGGTSHSGRAGLELRVARRTWLGSVYGIGSGPLVRYTSVPLVSPVAASSGEGSGQGSGKKEQQTTDDVFGEGLLATRDTAISHSVVVDLEQGLGDQVYLRGFVGLSRLESDGVASTARFAQVSVGVRLP